MFPQNDSYAEKIIGVFHGKDYHALRSDNVVLKRFHQAAARAWENLNISHVTEIGQRLLVWTGERKSFQRTPGLGLQSLSTANRF